MNNKQNGRHARTARQADANLRGSEREARTPKQQLKALDARLGKGIGAQRERAKLEAQL
jgi:hypothetical protein